MKTTLWVLLFLCTSVLFAEVLFYDNFNRTEGAAVGNGWVNIGPVNPIIENGAMKVVSSSLQGVRRDFTTLSITSGTYYVNYDWKIASNTWLADAFPNGTITYLRQDYEGNLYYDNTSDFSNPVNVGTLAFNTWVNIKLKVNLDSDLFSLWLNGTPVVANVSGLAVSDFVRFTFRAGTGSNVTQYIDNFTVFDDAPPAAPTDLVATGALNQISLSWNGTYEDLLSYRIYRSTSSPASEILAEVPGTQTTFVDDTAAPNTDYFYRVKAISLGIIESGYSNEVMSHLQPLAYVEPTQITFNVGYGYSDSTYITIYNNGNYPLNWLIMGEQTAGIPTDALIAYYPFNGNTMNETGLSQYNAINSGAVFTADRFGDPNKALDFNGTSSRLSFSENFSFNNEMSISCWVNERAVSYAGGIISSIGAWSLYASTLGNPGVRFYSNGENILDGYFSLNEWHHIVAVAGQNYKKLYIDGELAASDNYGGVNTLGPPMYIGDYGCSYYWNGLIDDMAVYNRAINQDEVSQLYLGQLVPIVDYSMSPNSGTIDGGSSQQVQIKLTNMLLDIGTHIDTLTIYTNDNLNPQIQVIITTNVLPPVPSISPTSYEVNINATHPTRNVPLQIDNSGSGDLEYQLMGSDNLLVEETDNYTYLGLYRNHRYYLSNSTSTWIGARLSSIIAGGHLVTITSQLENAFVSSQYTSQAWIGLTDESQEGAFEWVTDEPLNYSKWWTGQPDNYDGGEDYGEINYGGLGYWNDQKNDHSWDGTPVKHILEIDQLTLSSILSFPLDSGILEANSTAQLLMYVNGASLLEGIYETSIILLSNALEPADSLEYPVVVNVDFTPPLAVTNLALDPLHTDSNQIGLIWSANDITDSVVAYNIYRRGRDDIDWRLLGSVPSTQLWYIDNQFTGLDSTYVYYRVRAEDWVGNLGAEGDSLQAALERFLAPDNVQITTNNNRDVLITWDPVMQTISGLPGTPSCYVIYKSQYPIPITDFDFLSISFTNEFTHQWALHFQPLNRLFYVVTAYGGDMGRMNALVAHKQEWKFGELESRLRSMGMFEIK